MRLALFLLLFLPASAWAHGGEHHDDGAMVVAPACPGPNSGACCCDKLVFGGTQPPTVGAENVVVLLSERYEVFPGRAVPGARFFPPRNLARAPPLSS